MNTGTGHLGKLGTTSIPELGNTGNGHLAKFGTTWIRYRTLRQNLNTGARRWVRQQYRYQIPRYVRYDIDTGVGGTGTDVYA